MKKFIRLLKGDTKRIFIGKMPYIFITLLFLFAMAIIVISLIPNEDSELYQKGKSSYGVREYTTFEELNTTIIGEKENYLQSVALLDLDIEQENVTANDIKYRQYQIDTLNRTIITMQYLYDNQISFERYQDYYSVDNMTMNQKDSETNLYSVLVLFATIAIGFITVIRASVYLPSEIKDGKSKIMFTLPLKRVKYLIYRFLFIFLQSVALLIAYAIFFAIVLLIIYGGDDVLLFATANTVFGLSYIPTVFFILIFSLLQLFAYTLFAYCISLLFLKRVLPLIISVFILFGNSIVEPLINLIFGDISKYFISNNLTPLKAFTYISHISFFGILLILALYLVPLSLISLYKIKKQDIFN